MGLEWPPRVESYAGVLLTLTVLDVACPKGTGDSLKSVLLPGVRLILVGSPCFMREGVDRSFFPAGIMR